MVDADFLSRALREVLLKDSDYGQAVDLVKSNSSGNLWLIGGYVFKSLVNVLYGGVGGSKDFDFVVEQSNEEIVLPEGWAKTENRFGNWKFSKQGCKPIDFILLRKIYQIEKRGLRPCIENYLKGVPLNFHSIAWDVRGERLIGDVGLRALEERVVKINDLEMARLWAERYDFSLRELVEQKAREIGFEIRLG